MTRLCRYALFCGFCRLYSACALCFAQLIPRASELSAEAVPPVSCLKSISETDFTLENPYDNLVASNNVMSVSVTVFHVFRPVPSRSVSVVSVVSVVLGSPAAVRKNSPLHLRGSVCRLWRMAAVENSETCVTFRLYVKTNNDTKRYQTQRDIHLFIHLKSWMIFSEIRSVSFGFWKNWNIVATFQGGDPERRWHAHPKLCEV